MLIDDLRKVAVPGKAVVVVGTGVSLAASGGAALAGWPGLLRHGLDRCRELGRLDADVHALYVRKLEGGRASLRDLLDIASLIEGRLHAPQGAEFGRWLAETVGEAVPLTERALIEAIDALGLPILTTNYDSLIEQGTTDRDPVTWQQTALAAKVLRGESRDVLHLHGHWKAPESVVLGGLSYDGVASDAFSQALKAGVATLSSFIFIGCGANGLGDPDFDPFFTWFQRVLGQTHHRHYVLCQAADARPPVHERVFFQPYGADHADLLPFLRSLAPATPPLVPVCAPAAPTLPPLPKVRGRETEIETATQWLAEARPFAVIGGPGIGKSTVALSAIHNRDILGPRRWFVRLDGVKDAGGLFAKIGEAMGLEVQERHRPAVLMDLAVAPAALVLDNFEDPWDGDPDGVEEAVAALAAVPGLALAVAARGGRWPGAVDGDAVLHVHPLPKAAAHQLFLDIAGSKFATDPDLDGLVTALGRVPLALRLLAFLAQPEPDLAGLRQRWQEERTALLKTGKGRDRDLDASIALSLKSSQLNDNGRALLSLLGLLPDGVSRADLRELLPGTGDAAAHNVASVGLAEWDSQRLRPLAPVREYLAVHVKPTAERSGRCLWYYLAMATEGDGVGRKDGGTIATRLAGQVANLEAMLGLAVRAPADAEVVARAVWGYAEFSRFSGLGNALPLLRQAAKGAVSAGKPHIRANCLTLMAMIHGDRAEYEPAIKAIDAALALFRRYEVVAGEAQCTRLLGLISLRRWDLARADAEFRRARSLYHQIGDAVGVARCIHDQAEIELRRSELDSAASHYGEAADLLRRAGDPLTEGHCAARLGAIAMARCLFDRAAEHLRQARDLCRSVGDTHCEADCIVRFGEIALCRGDFPVAASYFAEALPFYRQVGGYGGEGYCHFGLARIAFEQGDWAAAATGAADVLAAYRQRAARDGEAEALCLLAKVALADGKPAEARQHFTDALAALPPGTMAEIVGDACRGLGDVAAAEGDPDAARRQWLEARAQYARLPNPDGIARIDQRLARIAGSDDERRLLVAQARAGWLGIGLDWRVAALDAEFPPDGRE